MRGFLVVPLDMSLLGGTYVGSLKRLNHQFFYDHCFPMMVSHCFSVISCTSDCGGDLIRNHNFTMTCSMARQVSCQMGTLPKKQDIEMCY